MENVTVHDLPQDSQLVDVREADEYTDGHAVGAINIPLSELMGRYQELDFDTPAYIICLSGGRSARACQFLEQNGLDVINVSGGTLAWRDAGLPMETGNGNT
ncbi:rhodanese-like domain-containing protein [Corynebacterium kroppenstedtii]|uniref:rhodanese-like domain-containing protein n=1 Tax=Corynebacterium sp. PCR 32 TaxID=3351342 RepID=UPI0030AEEC21